MTGIVTPAEPLMSQAELQVILTYIYTLAIPVCIFGLCSNVVNIVVFSRMGLKTPSNINLFCLAIADWLTLAITTVVVFGEHPYFQNANHVMSMRDVSMTAAVVYPGVSAMGSWITTIINVERACCVAFPMKVRQALRCLRNTAFNCNDKITFFSLFFNSRDEGTIVLFKLIFANQTVPIIRFELASFDLKT